MEYQNVEHYKYKLYNEFSIMTDLPPGYMIDHRYFSLVNSRLVIKESYLWDGVSGPGIDTQSTMIPSLVHDALYQAIRIGSLPLEARKKVDLYFRKLLRHQGIGAVRSTYYYFAVRVFGAMYCIPGTNYVTEVEEV